MQHMHRLLVATAFACMGPAPPALSRACGGKKGGERGTGTETCMIICICRCIFIFIYIYIYIGRDPPQEGHGRGPGADVPDGPG